jgi:hypothetical protein
MKSHESVLTEVVLSVVIDASTKLEADPLISRDLDTIRSRVKNEGLSFLTITLPQLGSDLELSLSKGEIAPNSFRSFKKLSKIPAFLQGFFRLIFDQQTGRINDEPSIEAISALRQIAYTLKKLNCPTTSFRNRRAIEGFKADEQDLLHFAETGATHPSTFYAVCDLLWPSVLNSPIIRDVRELKPKHGPGSVAESYSSNQKFKLRTWHRRLEPFFNLDSFALPSWNALESKMFEDIQDVSEEDELPVKVTLVPKTLKGPRIIAIEPACMQYTQQALSKALVRVLETSALTKGHVNFTDQSINQMHALRSSKSGTNATLDLSSASDRVPLSGALYMFNSHPDFRDAIYACRSKTAKLPDGEVIHLKKFASMGSALCFPVESMYFYTSCIAALLEMHHLPVTYGTIKFIASYVYVYGDDIIVPAYTASVVSDYLHRNMCKVNTTKSFSCGKFRESCGMDAFDGVDVTPVYLRQDVPTHRRMAKNLISWVTACNGFHKIGYWRTSLYLQKIVEKIIGKLPIVHDRFPGLGLVNHFGSHVSAQRWNKAYHRHEVMAWSQSPVYREDKLDDYPALLKFFLSSSSYGEQVDEKHLERSARHGAVKLKRRWLPSH